MTETSNALPPADTKNIAPPKSRIRVWIRRMIYVVAGLAVLLGAAWMFGPREPVVTDVSFDATTLGDDIDAYLAAAESEVAGIKPGQQKEVIWAFPESKAKTPVSLVYMHGFSASRGETYPVLDQVGKALDANIFYTRFKGHGQEGAAMAGPTVEDWMKDTAEAIAIGNEIGEKTVLVTVSTGGTLAAIAAFEPSLKDKIDAIVFISPNFKVKAAGSELLSLPFARNFVPLLVGATRSFEPVNAKHAEFWTYEYPTVALLPMAASVEAARKLPFEKADIPALFVFDPEDNVVDSAVTARIAERWGAPVEVKTVPDNEDPYHHVIAGDALSPATTGPVSDIIAGWVNGLQ